MVKSADGSWTPPKELGQQKGYRYLHNGRQQRDFLDDLGVEAEGAKPSDLIDHIQTKHFWTRGVLFFYCLQRVPLLDLPLNKGGWQAFVTQNGQQIERPACVDIR